MSLLGALLLTSGGILACKGERETVPPAEVAPAAPKPKRGEVIRDIPEGLPGDPMRGTLYYSLHCSGCHGDAGAGDGPRAAELDPPPPPFRALARPGAPTNPELFALLRDGRPPEPEGPGGGHPGFEGSLTREQIWDVIAYVRTLAGGGDEPSG